MIVESQSIKHQDSENAYSNNNLISTYKRIDTILEEEDIGECDEMLQKNSNNIDRYFGPNGSTTTKKLEPKISLSKKTEDISIKDSTMAVNSNEINEHDIGYDQQYYRHLKSK